MIKSTRWFSAHRLYRRARMRQQLDRMGEHLAPGRHDLGNNRGRQRPLCPPRSPSRSLNSVNPFTPSRNAQIAPLGRQKPVMQMVVSHNRPEAR